jgi:hypothetical protein
MKISDLEIGQIGYYYAGSDLGSLKSVKFEEAIISGGKYVACWHNAQFIVKKTKEAFFDTFGIFCNSDNPQYNSNYQCFLTEQEVSDYSHDQKINDKIKRLEEKKETLLQIKFRLLETEKELISIDFEKEKLELEKKFIKKIEGCK